MGGDHRVLKLRLSSGVTNHITRVYVKIVPMLTRVPVIMSRIMKMMKGPVAPVVERVNTDWVRAISDAATISGAYAYISHKMVANSVENLTFCIGRKYHDRVLISCTVWIAPDNRKAIEPTMAIENDGTYM
jgi:formaldehyde-activating enzyme involved in methanogenesis